jgi:hypothetical protein
VDWMSVYDFVFFNFRSFAFSHPPTLICIHAVLETKKESIFTSVIFFFCYTVT